MDSSTGELETLVRAAKLHLVKDELQETVERSTKAIRLDGKEPAAYLVRAEAHRRLKHRSGHWLISLLLFGLTRISSDCDAARRSLELLRHANRPEFSGFLSLLEQAVSSAKGLYVTF